jgi:putative spermidine/putrescine transport system substrate-binding protein
MSNGRNRSYDMTIITRRRLLTGAAAGAAALPFVTNAFAQGRLTVTSYGGTWEKAQREIYAPVFKAKNAGWDVDVQLGGPPQWLSQIEANASAPPIHVSLMPVELALAGGAKGLFEKISVDKVPNLKDVPKPFVDMCEGWGVCVNYGAELRRGRVRLSQGAREEPAEELPGAGRARCEG